MAGAIAAAVFGAAACGGAPHRARGASDTSRPLTPAQIAERAQRSIVLIKTASGLGTGFVVWQDGRIATNLHVIRGQTEATVVLPDGREFTHVEVLAADEGHDLAVLRIPVRGLAPLTLGDEKQARPGDRVVAIGHPLGLGNTVSDGLLSAIRQVAPELTLLQISAPISPGSSGGPLFNERGEVIGVATMYSGEGQNLNFAVPVSYLKPLLLSDDGISLAELARRTSQADLSALRGCTPEELQLSAQTLVDAINVGAPIYNQGDHEGCYRTYQAAALELVGKLKTCTGVREILLAGLSQANGLRDPKDQAWAMRHAFDRILDLLSALIDQSRSK